MPMSTLHSAKKADNSPVVLAATAFVVVLFLLGGASRGDVLSLPFLRAFVGAVFVLTLVLAWPQLKIVRYHLGLLALFAIIVALHLVPLPHALWSSLPGRSIAMDIDAAAGLGQIARPLTFDPFAGWNTLFSLLVPAASLSLFALVEPRAHQRLVVVVVVLALLSAFVGLGQLVSGSSSALYLYRITNSDSAVGFMANRNHHALMLACAIPLLSLWLSTVYGKIEQVRLYQLLAAVGVAFLIPSIVMTGSRAGLVLAVIGVAAAILLYRAPGTAPQTRDRKIMLFDMRKLAGAAVVIGVVAAWSAGRLTAFDRINLGSVAEVDRLAMLPTLWQMAMDYFPAGGGAGSFVALFRLHEPFALLNPSYYNHAHFDALELLIEFGVLGVVLIAASVIWFVRAAILLLRTPARQRETFTWRAGCAGLWLLFMCAVASITDYPLRVPSIQMLACLAVLWVVLACRPIIQPVVKAARHD